MILILSEIKKRLLIILLVTICCLIIPSQFEKGGAESYIKLLIFSVTFGVCFFFIAFSSRFIFYEKMLSSIITSFLALITSLYITEFLLESIYGVDYELHVNKFVANGIFYFCTNVIGVALLYLLLRFKADP